MAKITDVKDTYKCDECKRTFKASEVVLRSPIKNIDMIRSVMVVGADDCIYSTRYGENEGDRIMHCPHCNHVHLFGFDVA